jgi:alpha-beta hydrolase superfamily lysophospholipase
MHKNQMKIMNCLLIAALFISNLIWAQDGKIINKVPLILHDSTYYQVNKTDTAADQLCKTTPLLIMQGSADWRTLPGEVLEFVKKLYEYKHPVRFILYEGADHGIREFPEHFSEIKRHFDYYLRNGNKWPSMEPHG